MGYSTKQLSLLQLSTGVASVQPLTAQGLYLLRPFYGTNFYHFTNNIHLWHADTFGAKEKTNQHLKSHRRGYFSEAIVWKCGGTSSSIQAEGARFFKRSSSPQQSIELNVSNSERKYGPMTVHHPRTWETLVHVPVLPETSIVSWASHLSVKWGD